MVELVVWEESDVFGKFQRSASGATRLPFSVVGYGGAEFERTRDMLLTDREFSENDASLLSVSGKFRSSRSPSKNIMSSSFSPLVPLMSLPMLWAGLMVK